MDEPKGQADYEARIRSTLADPIPEAPADEEVEGDKWVLMKGGAFWRPNSQGYTNNLAEAGLYTDEESLALTDNPDVTRLRYSEALKVYGHPLRRSTETDKPGVREAIDPRVVIDDDGGPWLPDDTGHPRHAGDKRGEIELFIRDAYASGCRAGQNRSLTTAVEYANRHAPELIRRLTLSASPLTEEQPTHRHKKRGTEYVLIGIGKMQAELWVDASKLTELPGPAGRVDMREVAIYRSATDPTEIWARPREEFEDGRFEPLPRSTTGGAK